MFKKWEEVLKTDLVSRCNQRADQTGDNHDLIDQDGVEDGWPWHAGGQEQVQK